MHIKKILVTGSSGTVGTALCEKLLAQGYDVRGIDNKPNKWNSKINALTTIGDLTDTRAFESLPKDFDLVVHLAANARVYRLVGNPRLARDNFEMLFNTLEFCRNNGIKRVLFTSSREVYGDSRQVVHSENEAYVKNCESAYTASKIGGEALMHAYKQCYGIAFIIVRLSNVYGKYDDQDRIIPNFIRLAKANQSLTVYGEEKILDFTYIDDAISGIMSCIMRFDYVKNDIFNIASGKGVSLVEVAKLIQSSVGSKSDIIIKESLTGEVTKYVADISKAKKILDYEPLISIIDGIGRSVEWYIAGGHA